MAFSLVRFRSAPGSAREILSIFTAMAAGLATGVGYIGIAAIFVILMCTANILYTSTRFGEQSRAERELKITVPENLNYTDIFEDLFKKYTVSHKLKRVKTTNMGSLYQLTYTLRLNNASEEKELIDSMRCRKADLTVNGEGTLNVSGNYKCSIVSKDDLVISGLTLTVDSVGCAIEGKDCVKASGAKITLNAGGDGIKSTNSEDANRGFVYIESGSYNITAQNDGIQAQTVLRISDGEFNINTGGSANASTKHI